jgi:DNA polymerase
LSNIEGRGLAWIAGERWKLDAFAAFDAGKGPDLYKLAYARDFGMRPQDVTKAQRQIGKVRELALGFEGGVGAFATFAAAYGIDLEQMARSAWDTLPDDLLRESTDFHQWASFEGRDMFGLSREAFITCDVFKRAWRKGHPATAGLWKELQAAVLDAIETPSTEFKVRALRVIRTGAWLRIVLPSGRSLCYPSPRADAGKISYMGVAQGSRKWERLSTYGGKLVENVTQAVARDVMAANMPTIERAGFRIVLTVHDEIVTEAPLDPAHDHLALSHLLATPPAWAQGMPLAASGFQADRYRKD